MTILFNSILLLFLFIALGWSADFTVKNIKYIGAALKIRLFAFGIVLGLITTLPELSLGINATVDQAATLSVGNLLGGIIVMLGLIAGLSLIFNRKTNTDGRLASILPTALIIFSPILFGIDGNYGVIDGLAMIGLYLFLIFYLYRLNHFSNHVHIQIINRNKITKAILCAIAGTIGVLVSSHWLIKITLDLLTYTQLSPLVIGLVVFSVGTNLPEISIAITSWRKKSSELSLSHLLGSSFTNILVLGILSILQPIVFDTTSAYWVVALFLGIILTLFTYFYYSNKKMERSEGTVLLTSYIFFMTVNFYLISKIL
jgi:cation:H+ antiporter